MTVEELRAQLEAVRDQMRQRDVNNPREAAEIERYKAQEAELEAQISEMKTAALEEKVQAEAVHIAIEGVKFDELPTSLVTVIDKVVKADRKIHFTQHAIEIEQIENAAEERELQLRRQNDVLKERNGELETRIDDVRALNEGLIADNGKFRADLDKFELENTDLRSKLANAAAQIAEKDAEIERLKSQISDYQKAKVFGEREAQNVIEATPSDAEEINNAIKHFLSAEDWGSVIKAVKPDGTFERVSRAEFEAEWQPFPPPALATDGGSNDGATFLGSDQAESNDREGTATLPAMEVSQFPTEDTAVNVAGNTAVPEGDAQEVVSRAEFEALKKDVERLKEHVFAPCEDSNNEAA